MNKLTLTVFSLLSFLLLTNTSCKKEDENERYVTNPLVYLNGLQVVPANTSLATGLATVTYDKKSKLLSYSITYSKLSGNPTAIHIHGLGTEGVVALPSPLGPYANGIIQSITSGLPAGTANTYTGTLNIDGIAIKEDDLLNGRFYIDIHTAAFAASGEIRGQVTFPN